MSKKRPVLLFVGSRWPWPVATGHQRMMDQMLRFASLDYEVSLAVACREPGETVPDYIKGEVVSLGLPSMPEIMSNLVTRPWKGTLQECLVASRQGQRDLGQLESLVKPKAVIFDMLRTAGYTTKAGTRRIMFLDDLLSDRYASAKSDGAGILGAFSNTFPRPVALLASFLPKILMSIESRLAARAENASPDRFEGVLLVSDIEASRLKERTGSSNISSFPPSVSDLPEPQPWKMDRPPRFVFLGSPKYAPNARALKLFDQAVGALVYEGKTIDAVAAGTPCARLQTRNIRSLGYVEDLSTVLTPDSVLVAPIDSGTGIKTKIIDAMAHGVPVITTRPGVEGLAVVAGTDVVIAEGVDGFAGAIETAIANPQKMEDVGMSGYRYVRKHHCEDDIRAAFLSVLKGDGA